MHTAIKSMGRIHAGLPKPQCANDNCDGYYKAQNSCNLQLANDGKKKDKLPVQPPMCLPPDHKQEGNISKGYISKSKQKTS